MVAKYTADVKESPTAQSAKSSQTQNAVNLLILYIMKINVQRRRKLLMRNILFYFEARNTFQKKLQQWHGVLPHFCFWVVFLFQYSGVLSPDNKMVPDSNPCWCSYECRRSLCLHEVSSCQSDTCSLETLLILNWP